MSTDTSMFTQCPECQTVFRVTMEQLKVREGLVRCGKCSTTFHADQHLYAELDVRAPKKTKTASAPKKAPKSKAKSASAKYAPEAAKAEKIEPETIEVTAAPAPWSPPGATPQPDAESATAEKPRTKKTKTEKQGAEPEQISLAPLLDRRAQPPQSNWWITGSVMLFIALGAQAVYFYRDTLAQYPQLRPFILDACEKIGCVVRSHSDVNAIELVEPTGISPHPRAANALRLRATLVNRSAKAQPYPLMQVTLTDATGHVLSRRTFAPKEYLEQPSIADSDMPPHLAISALLDLTNPEEKAVGYQIDFIPAPF